MQRSVQIGYRVRVVAYGYLLFVIGLHLLERSAGALAYGLLVLQCLVFPQLAYLHARRSANANAAERINLYAGTALLGVWTAGLGFPIWIAYLTGSVAVLAGAVTRGLAGAGYTVVLYILGILAWVVPFGYRYEPATGSLVTAMCILGAMAYAIYIGIMAHQLRRDLKAFSHLERRSRDRLMGPFNPDAGA